MTPILKPEDRCPHEPPTKLIYWHDTDSDSPIKTAHCGVVEVITETSAHPTFFRNADRAPIGETVIRMLNKDGNPTALYERFLDPRKIVQPDERKRWFPEGVEPAQKK